MISVFTLLLCILGFILCGFAPFNKYLNIANVALIGSSILFVTKTIDYKTTLKNISWDVLLTVGFIATLGVALEKTGAGKLIAEQTLAFFGGEDASLNVILCVMFVLGSFLTLFMSNVAVSAMLAPNLYPSGPADGPESGAVHHPDCHCVQYGHCNAHRDAGEHADFAGRV